jgi:fatty-acyl-CoA synthase
MAKELVITEEYTIPRAFKERCQLIPEVLALADARGKLTYRQFEEKAGRIASGLVNLGIQPGEKIALVLPSDNHYPVAMYGIIQMGAISVGINPTLRPNEFRHIFTDSEAVAVIVAETFYGVDPLSIIREMRNELPHLRHVIVVGNAQENEINYQEWLDSSESMEDYYQADPDDLAVLVYTSGTTGLPKGSMHSHKTTLRLTSRGVPDPTLKELLFVLRNYGLAYVWKVYKLKGKSYRIYGSTPPYTAAGMVALLSLNMGGYSFFQTDRYVPEEVLKLVEKERIHVIGCPPAVGALLLKNPNLDSYDLSSLVYILLGAAPVPPSLVDEFFDKIGVPIVIGYGASEIFDLATSTSPLTDSKEQMRETVGKLNPDYEAKVVNENREPLPLGEVGELVLRGKVKMMGYYKAEGLTRQTFDEDGWYYTGDLATIDKNGYVRIVGRVKDLIIRGGQNIYPAEIEDILITHPKVKQASVVGIPDAIAGEKVLAFIIPESGSQPTILEILQFCRENMAPYKVPGNVYFVNEFPLNATGKVLKRVLREEAIKKA